MKRFSLVVIRLRLVFSYYGNFIKKRNFIKERRVRTFSDLQETGEQGSYPAEMAKERELRRDRLKLFSSLEPQFVVSTPEISRTFKWGVQKCNRSEHCILR